MQHLHELGYFSTPERSADICPGDLSNELCLPKNVWDATLLPEMSPTPVSIHIISLASLLSIRNARACGEVVVAGLRSFTTCSSLQ